MKRSNEVVCLQEGRSLTMSTYEVGKRLLPEGRIAGVDG